MFEEAKEAATAMWEVISDKPPVLARFTMALLWAAASAGFAGPEADATEILDDLHAAARGELRRMIGN